MKFWIRKAKGEKRGKKEKKAKVKKRRSTTFGNFSMLSMSMSKFTINATSSTGWSSETDPKNSLDVLDSEQVRPLVYLKVDDMLVTLSGLCDDVSLNDAHSEQPVAEDCLEQQKQTNLVSLRAFGDAPADLTKWRLSRSS